MIFYCAILFIIFNMIFTDDKIKNMTKKIDKYYEKKRK